MRLENKPAAIVVHVRGAEPAVAERVLDAVRTGPAQLPGVESTEGKAVLEMAVVQVSKGAAIDTLRGRLGADAVLFVGDDVTDETAFARLRPGDVGVKVGEGDTAAGYRVGTPEDVTDAAGDPADGAAGLSSPTLCTPAVTGPRTSARRRGGRSS